MSAANKSALDAFHKDCLKFGSLKCFQHFQLYLKGREELVVTVFTSESDASPGPMFRAISTGGPANALPPASPARRSGDASPSSATVFLVGGYSKYSCPYVWLRSAPRSTSVDDMDLPLDLPTTKRWKEAPAAVKIWDIVAELVNLNISPAPANPFSINLMALQEMPPLERALQAGALAGFLRELLMTDTPYAAGLEQDFAQCIQQHFQDMPTIVPKEPGVPAIQSHGAGAPGALLGSF